MTSYKSVSEITLDKYKDMSNHPIGKKAKASLFKWWALNGVGFGVMSANTFLCLKAGDDLLMIISAVFAVVFGYKLLIRRTATLKRQYNQIIASIPEGRWTRTITFGENITVADGNSTSAFKYSDFKYTSENKTYFLLYRNENIVLRVEKGSFITGDETKFLKWFNNKIK